MDESELQSAEFWSRLTGIVVHDPDGWRKDKTDWSTLITREDFEQRAVKSTVSLWPIRMKP